MSVALDVEHPKADATTARVAVVVPIFKHSVLVVEAIESALAQTIPGGVRVVLVNDGCPHVETDMVCRGYALAHPDRVAYLRTPNGGLSAARNHGIRYALATWSDVEAIYLLDADNRLLPTALQHAFAALGPGVDWVYPHIDMFGIRWGGDFGGEYSLLAHTAGNVCEAGSLVHRRVFEAGTFFDTNFKLGFEDWDFFLTAATAGFRGRNIDDFGFEYRKRPESMLADSERDAAVISAAMRRKHKGLMAPASLVALEQAEAPRYAIYLADVGEVILTVDPLLEGRRVSLGEFSQIHWRALVNGNRFHRTPFVVVSSSSAVELVRQAGVLRWVLWHLEDRVRLDEGLSAIILERGEDERLRYEDVENTGGIHRSSAFVMIGPRLMTEVLKDQESSWIGSISAAVSEPRIELTRLDVPASVDAAETRGASTAVFDFLSLVHQLRASPFREAASRAWDWRNQGIPARAMLHEVARKPTDGAPVFPIVRASAEKHVGFVLPVVEFGGVEKVALNVAAAMKRRGWTPHLFIIGSRDVSSTQEWRDTFASISFLSDPKFAIWGAARGEYFGTEVPGWATAGDHGLAIGLMSWLDVVVNFHGGAISGIMGKLKRLGVRTVLSLHLSDMTPFRRPVGNTFLGLAFEHAYDVFAPCSRHMVDWCHAMGVPRDKIVPVPNAPSFPVTEASLAETMTERAERGATRDLRVMYIGRLDAQKGLHRLADVIRATNTRKLPVEWRVIGKAVVVEGEKQSVPDEVADVLEPPMTEASDLAAAFAWADVFVLLSEYEGLPLTILEAMRSGVVTIATRVGAVDEAVSDGENGILLDLPKAVDGCVDAISRFCRDRDALKALAHAAHEAAKSWNWSAASEELMDVLERHIAGAPGK